MTKCIGRSCCMWHHLTSGYGGHFVGWKHRYILKICGCTSTLKWVPYLLTNKLSLKYYTRDAFYLSCNTREILTEPICRLCRKWSVVNHPHRMPVQEYFATLFLTSLCGGPYLMVRGSVNGWWLSFSLEALGSMISQLCLLSIGVFILEWTLLIIITWNVTIVCPSFKPQTTHVNPEPEAHL